MSTEKYTDELVSVNDLQVDPKVQRWHFNPRKVEEMVRNYDPNKLGRLTVSRRNPVTLVIVDGWHRWETVRRVTDSTGKVESRVFEDLSVAEEAQMFLDLNPGNQPTALDRYRMRLVIGDPVITAVDEAIHAYGWQVHPLPGKTHLQCVKALERIQVYANEAEVREGLLANTMLVVTHAFGTEREAGMATLLEGIAAFLSEYRNDKRFDQDRLVDRLKEYPSGAFGLIGDSATSARLNKTRAPMAVADMVTKAYNKGLRSTGLLPAWRRSR